MVWEGDTGAIALLTEAAVKAKDKLPAATWVGLIFPKREIAGWGGWGEKGWCSSSRRRESAVDLSMMG